MANGLLQKARSGNTVSSIFYLKTQAGWRETERREHSGPDGSPIEVRGAADRLRMLVDGMAERIGVADERLIEHRHAGIGKALPEGT